MRPGITIIGRGQRLRQRTHLQPQRHPAKLTIKMRCIAFGSRKPQHGLHAVPLFMPQQGRESVVVRRQRQNQQHVGGPVDINACIRRRLILPQNDRLHIPRGDVSTPTRSGDAVMQHHRGIQRHSPKCLCRLLRRGRLRDRRHASQRFFQPRRLHRSRSRSRKRNQASNGYRSCTESAYGHPSHCRRVSLTAGCRT
ncbi:hypothetical protein D3C71_1319660 [compost metagenome]